MMSHDFGVAQKSDVVSVMRSELTEVVANSVFRTPDPFVLHSLIITVRGSTKTRGSDADFEILNSTDFQIHCPLDGNDNLTAAYLKG